MQRCAAPRSRRLDAFGSVASCGPSNAPLFSHVDSSITGQVSTTTSVLQLVLSNSASVLDVSRTSVLEAQNSANLSQVSRTVGILSKFVSVAVWEAVLSRVHLCTPQESANNEWRHEAPSSRSQLLWRMASGEGVCELPELQVQALTFFADARLTGHEELLDQLRRAVAHFGATIPVSGTSRRLSTTLPSLLDRY